MDQISNSHAAIRFGGGRIEWRAIGAEPDVPFCWDQAQSLVPALPEQYRKAWQAGEPSAFDADGWAAIEVAPAPETSKTGKPS